MWETADISVHHILMNMSNITFQGLVLLFLESVQK